MGPVLLVTAVQRSFLIMCSFTARFDILAISLNLVSSTRSRGMCYDHVRYHEGVAISHVCNRNLIQWNIIDPQSFGVSFSYYNNAAKSS